MKPTTTTQCYCNVPSKEPSMIVCNKCRRHFHVDCLRSGKPSPLEGDIFFSLICESCSGDGEKISRQQIQWLQVVSLTLYNLSHSSSGKNGYFRWKEHICSFIDKHWHIFFGSSRKKTHTWHGTVAGTLSQGCPDYFTSGTQTLRESGWWKLADNNKPPELKTLSMPKTNKRYRAEKEPVPLKVGGLRSRQKKTSIQAAIELKAKRDTLQEAKEIRGAQKAKSMQAPPPPVLLPLTKKSLEAFADGGAQLSTRDELCSPDTSISEPPSCSTSRLGNHSFELASDLTDQSSQMSFSSTRSDMWLTDRDLMPGRDVPSLLLKEDEDEEEYDIDPCALSPSSIHSHDQASAVDSLPNMEDMLTHIGNSTTTDTGISMQDKQSGADLTFGSLLTKIKQEPLFETNNMPQENSSIELARAVQVKQENESLLSGTDYEDSMMDSSVSFNKEIPLSETPSGSRLAEPMEVEKESIKKEPSSSSESDDESQSDQGTYVRLSVPTNAVREKWKNDCKTPQELNPSQTLLPPTLYEERKLLGKLKSHGNILRNNPVARRLKRKLIVRQQKRQQGLPVFDIDAQINQITGSKRDLYGMTNITIEQQHDIEKLNPNNLPVSKQSLGSTCILDRYYQPGYNIQQQHGVSFLTRLVGTEDDQLKSIRSPYTSRSLKPFIRRDYDTVPMKMKLLLEIKSNWEKSQPSTSKEQTFSQSRAPIDYCYVRPQHIPSVNALCQQFFWPGIDVSECLQYPDFSCIVLYRKLVIGFAFMVPDVKYNEAYISFIFTHPEWRGAGIAQFMLYHLIQTCMGKDVTLHVAATNTAMLLYQKFGFKPEEFILDFYDKYFPPESRDSRHAYFLRLRR